MQDVRVPAVRLFCICVFLWVRGNLVEVQYLYDTFYVLVFVFVFVFVLVET